MAVKKDMWISGTEADEIMSRINDREVSADYVRLLSNLGKIRSRAKNGREKEYNKSDVEGYKFQRAPRQKKTDAA